MTIPHITIEQYSAAFQIKDTEPEHVKSFVLNTYNERIDKANAEQQAQPEPVDPHAALRAEYTKQVAEGTTGFYLWEWQYQGGVWTTCTNAVGFNPSDDYKYRYTDISCHVALKGEPAKRMLLSEARELRRQTKDTHDWFFPNEVDVGMTFEPAFKAEGTYTYAPKALKIVKWSDIPVGVMTNKGVLREVFMVTYGDNRLYATVEVGMPTASSHKAFRHFYCTDLELSPASEQPWIAVNGKFDKVEGLIYETKADAGCGTSDKDIACFKITGIAKGYVLEGAV